MPHTQCSRPARVRRASFVGILLAVALAISSQAGSEIIQAKGVASRKKGAHPEATAVSVKAGRLVSNPVPNLHRDLLSLQEGQKNLQRQLEGFIGATSRRNSDLERQLQSFSGQLTRLTVQQQELTTTQHLLRGTVRSVGLLLMIVSGLLIILCGVLFFFVHQVRQFGEIRLKQPKQPTPVPAEVPDRAYEAQWKVGS